MVEIDIHTHILPGIDDGADHLETALALLRSESYQGIRTVVLTPHYDPEDTEFETFVKERGYTLERLRKAAEQIPIQILVGAEVLYSPKLLDHAKELCIEGTSCMLIEFPLYVYPQLAIDVFHELHHRGITPIIAHGERYVFSGSTALLEKLTNSGAHLQVNVGSISNRKLRKRIYELAEREMITLLASDTHSPLLRPPLWKKCLPRWEKKIPGMATYCGENAVSLFGKEVLK